MVPKTDKIMDTGTGETVEVTVKVTANGIETTVVVAGTVSAMVQAIVPSAKATVVGDAETVSKDAADVEIVTAYTIMVVVMTPIMTITKISCH